MKNGNSVNGVAIDELIDAIGEQHLGSIDKGTPIRDDAFDMSDDEKVDRIADHFGEIMNIIGLDLTDDSLQGTPRRVAKMYIKEIFAGLNPKNRPAITLFENKYQYRNMLVEKGIPVQSYCEHHFQEEIKA